ncbi:MAG: hypothetical protein K2H15_06535 [Muribaculaceae bacterium]|nr:hypothetical protein [Muribaculaceae bacterium]
MREFYLTGSKIAGEACNLFTRKPSAYSKLVTHPITGKPCILVEMSRNASAEIYRELTGEDKELALKYDPEINLCQGDKLKADAISVYVAQKRPLSFSVSEGATHTHGAHFVSTKKNTLCSIRYPFDHIRTLEEKKNQLID